MQSQRRYTLVRRILFPYSGKEPLTRRQGLGVIFTWGMFFSFLLVLCTLPMVLLLGAHSLHFTARIIAEFMLIAFLSGVVIFGVLGWLVVAMSNRAARIMQDRNAMKTNTNGGRYGS